LTSTPYAYQTFAQAKQQLANRLYDPSKVFWTDTELGLYLTEALRTWNAHTAYWRDEFIFPTVSGTTWYDMTDQTAMPNTLRPYTVTDEDLYVLMQYHLLEPPNGATVPWAGSAQFTLADFTAAVQRRRDELLSTCSITTTRRTTPAVAGRITLSDRVIDVRRMAYLPNSLFSQSNSIVWPEDTWGEDSFQVGHLQLPAGVPETYLLSTQPPLNFDTNRPPAYAGDYELLTIDAGPDLVAGTPQTLLTPDDWTPILKWGALADLLSRESNSRDALRAAYCEQRYRMGLKLLMSAPALLAARVANVPLQIDSVRSADLYQTDWEAQTASRPLNVFHSGLNLIALSPVPDAGPYSATLQVVRNAPIPANDGAFIQVGRDDLDVVIDLAQHLAAFKQGGAEFTATIPLFLRFLQQASIYSGKLDEIAEYTRTLLELSRREIDTNPVMTPSAESLAGQSGGGTNAS
jgi:hypothetical protein